MSCVDGSCFASSNSVIAGDHHRPAIYIAVSLRANLDQGGAGRTHTNNLAQSVRMRDGAVRGVLSGPRSSFRAGMVDAATTTPSSPTVPLDGNHHPDGPEAGHALTIKLDHLMGADYEL